MADTFSFEEASAPAPAAAAGPVTFSFEDAMAPPPKPAGAGRGSVNPPAVQPAGADTTASDDAMRAGDPMGIVAQEQYKAPEVTGSVFDNQDQGGPRMDAPTNDAGVNERALDNARKSNPAIDKSPMYSTGLAREKAGALVAKGKVAQDKAEAERTKSSGNTAQDVALNVLGGFGGTVNKAGATISQAVGAEDAEAAFDSAAEMYKKMQADNGGGMLPGKVAGFVGSVAPAVAVGAVLPAAEAYVLLSNAGLFALPAFRDTLKEKLAAGQDFPLALAHASQSFGLNLFLPSVASKGGALLNTAAGKGIIGNAASAAAEGAGFSAATTVLDKGTDLVAGEKNEKNWLDLEDMSTMALGFGAMRGIHAGAGAAARGVSAGLDRVGTPSQQFGRAFGQDVDNAGFNRAQPANLNPNLRDVTPKAADPVADIFKTGSVAEAAAAAARAADVPIGEDTAAKLRAARPPRPVETPEVAELRNSATPEGALDERGDAAVPGLAGDAPAGGGDLAQRGVDPDVRAGGDGAPAGVDTSGAEGAPEAGAARVGLPAGDSAAVAPTVIATKPEANQAALKEDAIAVPVEGGFALQLKTRPYSDREQVAEQKEVDRLNRGLAVHSPEMEPARLLSTAPTPEMAVGRRIGRLLGVKVVFLEDHPDFRGVAESGVAYVTPQTKYPAIAIVGHEVFHAYADQHPESAEALKEQVRAYLNRDRVDERLGGVKGDRGRAEEEALADLNGAMWMDPKFWAEMRKNDPNAFRKIAYAFMQAVSHATQHLSRFKAEDFVSDVSTVRKIIAREMATLAREEGVSKHNPLEAEETGVARGVPSTAAAFGKDGVPMAEGGRPFKTRDAADDFRRENNPQGRVVQVDGGFAIRDVTDAESAARQKAGSRLQQSLRSKSADANPLLAFLAEHGMYHEDGKRNSLQSEFSPDKQINVQGFGKLFRPDGLQIDALTHLAVEQGFIPTDDPAHLSRLIAEAVAGKRIAPLYREEGASNEMQRRIEREKQINAEAAEDWSLTPDEVEATGFGAADADVQAQVRVLVARAEAHNIDGEGILETIARRNPNATTDEYLAAARDALQAAVPPEGDAGARDRGPGARGQGEEGQGLESYSEGDLRTRAARQDAATRADKAASAEADRRASAESPDSFKLTGSDRAADEAAARGQEPMFDRKAPDTPEFRRWFEGSRVVDEKGEPLVVYHGTSSNIHEFDSSFAGSTMFSASGLDGMFFTAHPDTADRYAKVAQKTQHEKFGRFYTSANIMPVYLALKNPLVYAKQRGDTITLLDTLKRRVIAEAKAAGNDGVIFKGFRDTPTGRGTVADTYVAFDPTQIKSATGNSGKFDKKNPDIRFDRKERETAPERKPGEVTREEARQMGDLRKKVKVLESLLECLG